MPLIHEIFTNKVGKKLLFCLILLNFQAFSQSAGNFVSYTKQGSDLRIRGTKGDLLLQVFTQDIFKVQLLKTAQASFDSSYSVVL